MVYTSSFRVKAGVEAAAPACEHEGVSLTRLNCDGSGQAIICPLPPGWEEREDDFGCAGLEFFLLSAGPHASNGNLPCQLRPSQQA
eukprot:scaffold447727_cov30-Prasinocladus_malaysianus.AAC.1